MKNYSVKTRRSRLSKFIVILFTFLLIIALSGYIVIRKEYYQKLEPVSASQKTILVKIPSGATAQEISKELQNQALIKSTWAFEWYVRTHDLREKLQAGTYSLRPNQSVQEIVNILTHGKVATDLVTILPGQRLDQIRAALISNAGFPASEVDKALEPSQYSDSPALTAKPEGASLEGYLYPDSYEKTADTKAETIIKASLDEMQKHLTPEVRKSFTDKGLTLHEGIILASVVEQEVSNPKDKPTVAQVFLTRRSIGMALGSDVTAFYGAINSGQEPSVLFDSPYNTRIHTGLPPGPISNVSDASLKAVANPAGTDYLYFVAGDDGITYFSHTLSEHESATALHCKKLCS